MKWHAVIDAARSVIEVDPVLVNIYGANMRYMGTGKHEFPLLEWMLIGDTEREVDAPCTVQFDQWCTSMEDLIKSEDRLRSYFHREVPEVFAGLRMWAQYNDGSELGTPNRDNQFGRAIRFRFTPLRALYEPVIPPT